MPNGFTKYVKFFKTIQSLESQPFSLFLSFKSTPKNLFRAELSQAEQVLVGFKPSQAELGKIINLGFSSALTDIY